MVCGIRRKGCHRPGPGCRRRQPILITFSGLPACSAAEALPVVPVRASRGGPGLPLPGHSQSRLDPHLCTFHGQPWRSSLYFHGNYSFISRSPHQPTLFPKFCAARRGTCLSRMPRKFSRKSSARADNSSGMNYNRAKWALALLAAAARALLEEARRLRAVHQRGGLGMAGRPVLAFRLVAK